MSPVLLVTMKPGAQVKLQQAILPWEDGACLCRSSAALTVGVSGPANPAVITLAADRQDEEPACAAPANSRANRIMTDRDKAIPLCHVSVSPGDIVSLSARRLWRNSDKPERSDMTAIAFRRQGSIGQLSITPG